MATSTRMTALEFQNSGPATDGFELVRGELFPTPPPGDKHGLVCMNVGFDLKTYTKQVGRGFVIGNDSGIITEKDPDSVRGVDVALFLAPNWGPDGVPDGYTDQPPDVAAEVRSPSQPWGDLAVKAGEYLRMGVRLVWVVDPKARRVTVFTSEREPQTFAAEGELDGGDALPGFRCRVADFFEGA